MRGLDAAVIGGRLASLESAREHLVKRGREISRLARRLSSYTLLGLTDDASRVFGELADAYRSVAGELSRYPELLYSNLFYSVTAEYVEAVQLYSVVFGEGIRGPDELGVHPVPYVLGLLDLVGELKRVSLESLRRGDYQKSFEYLDIAERVYETLSELSAADAVVPGFRRKLDIYRKVIDDWRALLIDVESRLRLERACKSASWLQQRDESA